MLLKGAWRGSLSPKSKGRDGRARLSSMMSKQEVGGQRLVRVRGAPEEHPGVGTKPCTYRFLLNMEIGAQVVV